MATLSTSCGISYGKRISDIVIYHNINNYSFSPSVGVWGSAFAILFNRVLGVSNSNSKNKGPTMEEELGIAAFEKYDIWQ